MHLSSEESLQLDKEGLFYIQTKTKPKPSPKSAFRLSNDTEESGVFIKHKKVSISFDTQGPFLI